MNLCLSLLEQCARGLASASWQVSLLTLFVIAATSLLRRARPMVRYALWAVVLIRLCLPWGFATPLGVASVARPFQRADATPAVASARASAEEDYKLKVAMPPRGADATRSAADAAPAITARAAFASIKVTAWTWCGLLWLIGAAVLSAFVLHRWSKLRRIVAKSEPCDRLELTTLLDELRDRFGIGRAVLLRRLPAAAEALGPCAAGWARPRILLPAWLADSWEVSALEPILIHELAHIRRADVVVNAIQVLAQVVYWFHPLVWFANARLRRERELICDDFAVLHSGATSRRYGETIFRALDEIQPRPGWSLAGVGMGESGLAQRLRRLLDRRYALPRPVGRAALGGLLFAGMLGILIASDGSPKKTGKSSPVASGDIPPVTDEKSVEPTEPPKALLEMLRRQLNPDDPRALPVAKAPKGELSGTVVNGHGKPVGDVLVDAWDWCPGNETRTAADGTFRLTELDPDERVEVRFIKDGFAPYTIIKQPLGKLTTPVVLDVETYFEGVVTASDGAPVANAFIRANQGPKQADGVQISTIWTETHSDAEGRYRLRVQDDTYDLQVTSPAGLVARLQKVAIGPRQVVPLDLRLEPGVVFRARVVDSETGGPIEGVRLHHWEHPGVQGMSDVHGDLKIAGLIPGPFEFEVDAKGHARWWSEECSENYDRRKIEEGGWQRNFDYLHFELKSGMEPVTIRVEKSVRIRGRIIDPDGNPVAGATAAPALTGTGNSLTGDTRFSVKTTDDGSFEMLLPAGNNREYNLIAHDGGYREWRRWANGVSEPFRTSPGQEIERFELKLNRPATLRGRVVNSAGNPVADREVRAQAADLRDNRYYDPTFRTDQDGRFEIKFIRPGKHAVQAAPFWLHPEKASPGSSWPMDISEGKVLEVPDLVAPEQN